MHELKHFLKLLKSKLLSVLRSDASSFREIKIVGGRILAQIGSLDRNRS